MAIKKLPPFLYNQIAAGEVVERPSSVVKELLENAKDAKAKHIILEVQKAGKALILVKDDGLGISYEDMPLSIEAHATSKIATQADLEAITTLGFRGEALASIAAVSKFKLSSKTQDQDHGYSISTNGLQDTATLKPCAHTQGTSVEVRDLFFNTPARRRFLKADRTELAHIKDIFIRQALVNDDINYTFISDSKTIINVKACSDEQNKLYRFSKLLSKDFVCNTQAVISEFDKLHIEGFILEPTRLEQAIADNIYIFLNSRPIADKMVMHAIKSAYTRANFDKSAVRGVLKLSINPHEVDINVHPRKDEVRFHNSNEIHHIIETSIYTALMRYTQHSKQELIEDLDNLDDLEDLEKDSTITEFKTQTRAKYLQSSKPAFKHSFTAKESSKINYDEFDDKEHESISKFHVFNQKNLNLNEIDKSLQRQNTFYSKLNKENKLHQVINYNNTQLETNFKSLSLLSRINANYLLLLYDCKYYLAQVDCLYHYHLASLYRQGYSADQVPRTSLSIPILLKPEQNLYKNIQKYTKVLERLGFDHEFSSKNILIHSYTSYFSSEQLNTKLIHVLKFLAEFKDMDSNLELDDFAKLCSYEHLILDTKDKAIEFVAQLQKDNIFLCIHKGIKFLDLAKIADEAFNDNN